MSRICDNGIYSIYAYVTLNQHVVLYIGIRDLIFGLSLHLPSNFVYGAGKVLGRLHVCVGSSEHLLLTYALTLYLLVLSADNNSLDSDQADKMSCLIWILIV